jgi:hypothetical protein
MASRTGSDMGAQRDLAPTSTGTSDSADLKEKATRGAQQLVDKASDQARSRLDREKQNAALTLSSVATTLLQGGNQLRDDQQVMAGEYIERAAKQVERVAHYVQSADFGEMVDNVEDFARKRPAVFIGSAFAVGLLAARFLKSSRKSRSNDSNMGGSSFADRQVPGRMSVETGSATNRVDDWQEQP